MSWSELDQLNSQMVYEMRKISLKALKGNEKLAMDLISESGIILMSKGSTIKKEYISRLKELSIDYLYIEDELSKGVKVDEILEIQIKDQCQKTVKDILERFTYSAASELQTLTCVAEEIILDILEEPEVMYNISGVRKKSESTYAHCVNVCTLSVLVAIKMKLPANKVREIAIGSLLHDIGYNYIAKDYSDVDMSTLNPNEIREIKKHVIYGYSAVEKEAWLSSVSKDIILTHHERIDGSGYPFHLNDDRIKLGSKIVAVCDEFDSKVYGFYTDKLKVHETIEYIMSLSGIKYDFSVVKIFYESVAAYPNGTTVITNEGETGIVLRQNRKCPTRPIIRIVIDKDGNNCNEWIEKDLTKDLTLFINDTIESY
ncbi:HD-GYP domain-containing protein (c-di-GMP phosphodiesterase class II) [Mobilisporobacter senegalensis]|uniref:HD-GYP domain-containing protein (C-di-GMP phosphodiesterase class II) n=2 Tax=Mobilisporobacter senegalensis TaxID=1329262 RepID=A0A3N1X5W0_9FIRM|nr:HD-GYP domain-containing protein (c-di-GMP phosphodiesterase class II) [Mobilisporobacter senegalensis]